jgi:hypothetical protein
MSPTDETTIESSDDLLTVEIPAPPHEAQMQIGRFLVELLGKRALAELGLLPENDNG